MKKKDFRKLPPIQQKLLQETVKANPNVTVRKVGNKGWSDLPLFQEDKQTKLF